MFFPSTEKINLFRLLTKQQFFRSPKRLLNPCATQSPTLWASLQRLSFHRVERAGHDDHTLSSSAEAKICCFLLRNLQLTFTVVCDGKADCLLFVNYSKYIPVKNTLGWSAFVFFGSQIAELVYVVFCVVTAVYKFYFRLAINGTLNIWRPVFVKQTR